MDIENQWHSIRLGRRRLLTASLAAAGLASAGYSASAHDASPTASPLATPGASPLASPVGAVFEASMQSLKFIPPEIDIKAGTTVTWKNEDVVAHTVTQRAKVEDQLVASPYIVPGDSFSFTFEKPGTYSYYCMPHPFMTGTVVVS